MYNEEMETRTVRVGNISDLAGEREIREFFSFSGDIEHFEIRIDAGNRRVAFVTFKEPKALEIALLLSGATIVDRIVNISAVENYVPIIQEEIVVNEETLATRVENYMTNVEGGSSPNGGRAYVNKAHVVVSNVLAKGSALKQDAISKAKAFDEKHRLSASASEKVISFDKRVGLSEKITVGISIVNERVKSVDQKLQVSDKTMAAIIAAERKLNDTGTAVKTNRYVSAGTSWLNGAFGKVAKAGHVAGTRTREKFQLAVSNLTAKDPVVAA
ncbi:binding partner of ACD11 1 [Canna indica]|uniref:Binding partner of ACD11 1 n=1 Tax=Canna indica TaxID=4628 RepID=A0AAQ3L1R9_9LILI|nr:binding partner of ACD11 1 [Canna indica]